MREAPGGLPGALSYLAAAGGRLARHGEYEEFGRLGELFAVGLADGGRGDGGFAGGAAGLATLQAVAVAIGQADGAGVGPGVGHHSSPFMLGSASLFGHHAAKVVFLDDGLQDGANLVLLDRG